MKFILSIALLSVSNILYSQDKIVKRDNSVIECRVLSFDGQKVTIMMPDDTEMKIPKGQIGEIKFGVSSSAARNPKNDGKAGNSPLTIANFGTRELKTNPALQFDKSQAGKVALSVCINDAGDVVDAHFKAAGSTTTAEKLVQTAIKHAKTLKFSVGKTEKQCGTVTYNFVM